MHPANNLPPAIRITAPAPDQMIVAGTFAIRMGIVASDDREIPRSGSHAGKSVALYANGVPLGNPGQVSGAIGGANIVQQAWDSIYDYYESRFGVATAEDYGRSTSPHAHSQAYTYLVPAGIFRENEEVTLTAYVD